MFFAHFSVNLFIFLQIFKSFKTLRLLTLFLSYMLQIFFTCCSCVLCKRFHFRINEIYQSFILWFMSLKSCQKRLPPALQEYKNIPPVCYATYLQFYFSHLMLWPTWNLLWYISRGFKPVLQIFGIQLLTYSILE